MIRNGVVVSSQRSVRDISDRCIHVERTASHVVDPLRWCCKPWGVWESGSNWGISFRMLVSVTIPLAVLPVGFAAV